MSRFLAKTNALELYKGASASFELSVLNGGSVVDLSEGIIYLSVKRFLGDRQPLLLKSSNVVSQIAITDPKGGLATVYFVPSDFVALSVGSYVYDVWVVLPESRHYVIIPPCELKVTQVVTHL